MRDFLKAYGQLIVAVFGVVGTGVVVVAYARAELSGLTKDLIRHESKLAEHQQAISRHDQTLANQYLLADDIRRMSEFKTSLDREMNLRSEKIDSQLRALSSENALRFEQILKEIEALKESIKELKEK